MQPSSLIMRIDPSQGLGFLYPGSLVKCYPPCMLFSRLPAKNLCLINEVFGYLLFHLIPELIPQINPPPPPIRWPGYSDDDVTQSRLNDETKMCIIVIIQPGYQDLLPVAFFIQWAHWSGPPMQMTEFYLPSHLYGIDYV